MGLFGDTKKKQPKDVVRECQTKLRQEGRLLDRQVRSIQREEEKAKRQIKDSVKKGNKEAALILAKEVLNSRKAIARLYSAKAQMKSVEYNMNNQLANIRLAGNLEKSTEVMKSMSELVKIKDVSANMRDLSREMMKAGIMEEMMEDVMSPLEEEEELEDEAQEQVDKILWEITSGEIGKAPDVSDKMPSIPGATARVESEEEEEEDVVEMQKRLAMLRS